MLCYAMLCYVMLCYVMLCYVMLCYVMLCYVMLCSFSTVISLQESMARCTVPSLRPTKSTSAHFSHRALWYVVVVVV